MKILTIARHAKSSWADPGLMDIDRPLNQRGLKAAPLMGKYLNKLGHTPQLVIASPAKRALKTAKLVTAELSYDPKEIQIDDRIYFQGTDGYFDVISEVDDRYESLFIFGHEPTSSSFCHEMTGEYIMKFATAGVFAMKIDIESWSQINQARGQKLFFKLPSDL